MSVYKQFMLATFLMIFTVGAFACDGASKEKEKDKKPKAERSLSL